MFEELQKTSQERLRVASKIQQSAEGGTRGSVYDYTDYRVYLAEFFDKKCKLQPSYSQSSFVRKAGLGKNSRGYLKLVIEGKRNLTPHTIRGFCSALGLGTQESLYFENLVYFNQAKSHQDKEYYFQRLVASASGKETKLFELMLSQYHYYSHWYYPPIRELVGLANFQEDMGWICAQLRNKVSRREASFALADLERLGMVRRDLNGKLIQSDPIIKYPGGAFRFTTEKFHIDMMERAKEALNEDDYLERNVSSSTLSCDYSRLPSVIREIAQFRDQLTVKYGLGSTSPDAVFQINFQIFQITPVKRKNPQRKEKDQ